MIKEDVARVPRRRGHDTGGDGRCFLEPVWEAWDEMSEGPGRGGGSLPPSTGKGDEEGFEASLLVIGTDLRLHYWRRSDVGYG